MSGFLLGFRQDSGLQVQTTLGSLHAGFQACSTPFAVLLSTGGHPWEAQGSTTHMHTNTPGDSLHPGGHNSSRDLLECSDMHNTSSSPPCDRTTLAGDLSGLVLSVTVSDEGGSNVRVYGAEFLLG
jgi:hypothetical protein